MAIRQQQSRLDSGMFTSLQQWRDFFTVIAGWVALTLMVFGRKREKPET